MNLTEALSTTKRRLSPALVERQLTYLTGHLEPDDNSQYVRLYLNPHNPTMYLRIRQEHIQGEIYEYTDAEITEAGLKKRLSACAPASDKLSIFQIAVQTGVHVEAVTVAIAKVGEKYPVGFGNTPRHVANKAKEQPEASPLAGYCTFSGVCNSGCQWCNDFTGCDCDCLNGNIC